MAKRLKKSLKVHEVEQDNNILNDKLTFKGDVNPLFVGLVRYFILVHFYNFCKFKGNEFAWIFLDYRNYFELLKGK